MRAITFLGVLLAVALGAAFHVKGQSLADVASREAERRKTISEPARIYTDKDLVGVPAEPFLPATARPSTVDATEQAAKVAQEDAARVRDAVLPANTRDGTLPALLSVHSVVVSGGQVFVELTVSSDGRVTAVRPLRTTVPFTELVTDAVRGWQFHPAEEDVEPKAVDAAGRQPRKRVESKVLVACSFRQPSYVGPTLGSDLPKDVAPESDGVPFPATTIEPPFPVMAFVSGGVLVEVQIDSSGAVAESKVVRSAPPFDEPAMAAARQWKFRPARVRGRPVPTVAYILFNFTPPRP